MAPQGAVSLKRQEGELKLFGEEKKAVTWSLRPAFQKYYQITWPHKWTLGGFTPKLSGALTSLDTPVERKD